MSPSSVPAHHAGLPGRSAAVLAALVLALAACAGAATPSVVPGTPATASATASPIATAAPTASPSVAPAFPATLTDDEGTAVTIPSEPRKIVSLTPAVTETLFAVGAGSRIVATDDASDFPAAAKALPHVVNFGTVDVEKVVSLNADLVIAGGAGFTSADAITKLRSLKVPVLVVSSTTIETIYADIRLVGIAVGAAGPAASLVGTMRAEVTTIADAATAHAGATGGPPRVFYDVGYIDTTGQIYAPGKGSFLAEMLGMLGVDAITGDATTYEIPLETLIQRDPQVIVLGVNAFYTPTPAIIAKRNGWKALTAVKTGDIRSVRDTEITRPGPRLPIGLRNLALALYPDLVIPSAAPSASPLP